MTSATWNKDVHVICAQFLRKPIKVLVGEMDTSIFQRVTQEIIKVSGDHDKLKELMKIIKSLNKSDETKEDESDDDDDDFRIQESVLQNCSQKLLSKYTLSIFCFFILLIIMNDSLIYQKYIEKCNLNF